MSYSGRGKKSKKSKSSKLEANIQEGSSSDGSVEESSLVGEYYRSLHRPGTQEYHTGTINALVLQYLEKSGLERTFKTLWAEAKSRGITLPDRMPDTSCKLSKFKPEYGAALLQSMDEMEGVEVLEFWTRFEKAEKPCQELLRTSMMLHIFVASIPFRKKQSSALKRVAIEELRVFLSQNSEELTKDEVCVPLFAFSFVQDPQTNPAFRNVFTKTWLSELRKTVKTTLRKHFETHTVIGQADCDLSLIYQNYLDEYGIPCEDKPNLKQFQSPSKVFGQNKKGHKKQVTVPTEEYKLAQARISDLMDHGMCLKQSLLYCQGRYYQLLQSTNHLLNAWRSQVQGDTFKDAEELASLLKSFPGLVPHPEPQITTDPDEEEDEGEAEIEDKSVTNTAQDEQTQTAQNSETENEGSATPPEQEQSVHENSESDSDISELSQLGTGRTEDYGSETDSMISNLSWMEGVPKSQVDRYSAAEPDLLLLPPMEPVSAEVHPPSKEDWFQSVDTETLPVEIREYFASLEMDRLQMESETISENSTHNLPEISSISAVINYAAVEPQVVVHFNPFPSPPRTYDVTPRNANSAATSIYIPASTQVGCSVPATPDKPSSRETISSTTASPSPRIHRIRPGVPRSHDAKNTRARWEILPEDKLEILNRLAPGNERTVFPSTRSRPYGGPSSAPNITSPRGDKNTSTGNSFGSTQPDYANIIVPKNIIREILSREKEKKTSFMASILGVAPPDLSKCFENSQPEGEPNLKPIQRQVKIGVAAVMNKKPTVNASPVTKTTTILKNSSAAVVPKVLTLTQSKSKINTSTPTKVATKQKSDHNLKKVGSNTNVAKKGTVPPPLPSVRPPQNYVTPKGSKSSENLNKRKS